MFTLLLVLVLAAVVLYNTFTLKGPQRPEFTQVTIPVPEAAAQHLAQAVQLPTISYTEPEKFDSVPFIALHQLFATTYPLVDSLLTKETVSQYSLLYTWPGTDPARKPVVLMAHLDVVPIEEATKNEWQTNPFSGLIEEGFIWGRGTLDDKVSAVAILEAIEMLLQQGFKPQQTIYLAFGHDEEIGGRKGAVKIAERLKKKGIEAAFVLDEGGIIANGLIPGINGNVAMIGIAEKGYMSIELEVNIHGGHSSTPAQESAISVLTTAVNKLNTTPLKPRISEPVNLFLGALGHRMPFEVKMAVANRWLLEGAIMSAYAASPGGNASVRTTTAVTILESGVKDNVMPAVAKATVNFRILPGETTLTTLDQVRAIIADERVKVTTTGHINDPSPVSGAYGSTGYDAIEKAVYQVFEDIDAAPSLTVATTDVRHYTEVSPNLYRFLPIPLTDQDLPRIHGINERIAIEDFNGCIRFYYQLMQNLNNTN